MSSMRANQAGPLIGALLVLALVALASRQVEGQRYQHQVSPNEEQQSGQEVARELEAGERVDKLASVSGDQFYQRPQLLADWYRQLALSRPELREAESNQYLLMGPERYQQQQQQSSANRGQQLFWEPYNLDYRALVSEFKRQSPLANPSRESRAFKPKLMSTARGFGKRAGSSSGQRHVTYADLLAAAANPGALMATNGKMSANAIR